MSNTRTKTRLTINRPSSSTAGYSPGAIDWLISGNAAARLLNFLIEQREFDYSETDIAEAADVSQKTVYREIPKFESIGLITNTGRVGRAKMYKLNIDSKIAKLLVKLCYEIAVKRVDKIITIDSQQKNTQLEVQELTQDQHLVKNKIK
jgi:Fe2+ or Zn2+ uptake regulation protein